MGISLQQSSVYGPAASMAAILFFKFLNTSDISVTFAFYNGRTIFISSDLDLPDGAGLELLDMVRATDKIQGLTLVADDYIAKPFNPLEVVARIKSSYGIITAYSVDEPIRFTIQLSLDCQKILWF